MKEALKKKFGITKEIEDLTIDEVYILKVKILREMEEIQKKLDLLEELRV